jgi:polysaccharide export outer membrane protein
MVTIRLRCLINIILIVPLFFLFAVAPVLAVVDEEYIIGDGDSLQISVWGEPALNTITIVRPDGKITLPGIGDIVASGLSTKVLSERLSVELSRLIKKAIVTVTVINITNNKIYVFGGGPNSGVYQFPERTTLLRFLCRLGNLKGADLQNAYILRNGKKLEVNFYSLFIKGDLSGDTALKSGDMLYIPDNELNKIYIMGAVNTPKHILHREGIKILDSILEAGGFTKFAKENNVLVLRKDSGGVKEIRVKVKDLMQEGDINQNIPLIPGDYVIIKESLF